MTSEQKRIISKIVSIALVFLVVGVMSGGLVGAVQGQESAFPATLPELLSIAVTPPLASIPLGLTQQFTATGTYTDSTTAIITSNVTWSSSNTSVATISATGLATSVNKGTTTITASLSGKTSPGATLMVTAAELLSLAVSPATATVTAGLAKQFTATGNFTNGFADITNTATWTSSDGSIASIQTAGEPNPGLATGHQLGTVTITATQSGFGKTATLTVTAGTIASIAVTPVNPTITLGSTQSFRAMATKTDGSVTEVTTTVTWTSSNTTVATISAAGLATGLAVGTTVITATLAGVSGSTTLTVIDVPLVSIIVVPFAPAIAAGKTQQFTATGNYSGTFVDLTRSVTWSSSNNATARIVAGGLATSYAAGTTVITATSGTITGNTTLTVTPAVLDSVTVTPVAPSITLVSPAGPTVQFKATAIFSDGTTIDNTSDATWTSSAPGVATIDGAGLATTVAAGITTISATDVGTGISGNTMLTVLKDTVAPVVDLSSPAEGLITSSSTLTVTGTVNDVNATTTVIVNGVPSNLTLVSGSFSANVPLTAGSNNILVRAIDSAGNTGTSGTRTVLVDPRKPNISITSPAEGFITDNPIRTVTGIIVDAASTTLRVNGVVVATFSGSGNFSVNVALAEGQNILIASGYGAGGTTEDYRGTSGARTVTLDTTAPVVAITSPTSGSIVNTPGIKVTGTVNDPTVRAATLTLNGVSQSVAVVGGRFSQDVTLAAGSNTITVWAKDRAGNVSLVASATVTFDNTKPAVTITAPTNNQLTNVGGQLVTGSVSDPSITTATLYVNGSPQTISVAPDGSFAKMVSLGVGPNAIEVRATDGVNIGTSGVVYVNLDTVPPVLILGLSDPTDTEIITATSDEALAAVPTVKVDSTTVTMTQVGVNKWTGVYAIPGSGTYTVVATGTDLAGNPTTTTAVFTKEAVTIAANETATVVTGTTTLTLGVTQNVTGESITVTQHTENPAENTASDRPAGIFLEIVASGNLTNSIESVVITVAYDEADIIARGIDESTLKLYRWSTITGQWEVGPGSGVNTEQNYIFGTATQLSKYGAFGTPPAVSPPPVSPPPVAETSISQGLSTSNVTVVKVNIDRIKNPITGNTTAIPGGIGSYTATASSNASSSIQFLAVNGVSPFDGPSFNATTGVFSVTAVSSPIQASNTTVANVVPILTGNTTTSLSLTIAFQAIGAASDPGLSVSEEHSNSITLLRGDANKSGGISIADSLALKQYLVGQLVLSQISPLNAASPNHDGAGGDKITVADALAIEQYLVKQLNAYFE